MEYLLIIVASLFGLAVTALISAVAVVMWIDVYDSWRNR